MMIEEKLQLRPHKLVFGNLSQELIEYKKMNLQLLRSIQEKDQKIQILSTIIQNNKQRRAYTTKQVRKRNRLSRQIATLQMSANTQKNKENRNSIFTDNSKGRQKSTMSVIETNRHKQTSLPFIDKKFKNIFGNEDCVKENILKQRTIIKIPLSRLKPLNREEVRKRFLSKLNSNEVQLQ